LRGADSRDWSELFRDGCLATARALVAVSLHIWSRFEWRFGEAMRGFALEIIFGISVGTSSSILTAAAPCDVGAAPERHTRPVNRSPIRIKARRAAAPASAKTANPGKIPVLVSWRVDEG
jgi:hypothetical protein